MTNGGFVPIDTLNPNPPGPPSDLEFSIDGVGGSCSDPAALGPWVLVSYTEVSPICPSAVSPCVNLNSSPPILGVVEASWFRDYDFCMANCLEYEVSYSTCCRNSATTSGAANDGLYVGELIIRPNDSTCNASPVFVESPIISLCKNSMTAVSQVAHDPEGDSLVYTLVSCMDDVGTPVNYAFGYSPQSPLGPHWNVSIDAQTGWLTFVPGPLAGNERAVLCVQVEEYRNGAYIGAVTRDVPIVVIDCNVFNPSSQSPPALSAPQLLSGGQTSTADTIEACAGIPLQFQIIATDADTNDVLTISSNIHQTLAGAQLTLMGSNPLIIEVEWIPELENLNQDYELLLGVEDGSCPFPLESFRTYILKISGQCLDAAIMHTVCSDSTGSIDLNVQAGVPPYSFVWNTGDSTEDLTNLPPGPYWVEVTDSAGSFVLTDTFFLNASDLMLSSILTPPDCDGIGGQIELQVSGGTPPYTYAWSNGGQQSLLSGISAGGYSVIVMDSNACPMQEVFLLEEPDSCSVSISGKAFYDYNTNCIQDPNEPGIPFLYVEVAPGYATFTDANGQYQLEVDTGAYVIQTQPTTGMYLDPLCPANGQHSVSFVSYDADTSMLDFAMDTLSVQDLRVVGSPQSPPVPGFSYTYLLFVYNDGNLPISAALEWQLDPMMTYSSSLPPADTYDSINHALTWQLDTLLPSQHQMIYASGLINAGAVIGDSLFTTASVFPVLGDSTPVNNTWLDTTIIVGAFDPNDKQVSPAGSGTEGFISPEEKEMQYHIRFQNTGNFPAQFVIIRDTIHPNLDLPSFRPMTHSHPYSLSVEEDSILVFSFDDIRLPDSASDMMGSQGHVSFLLSHSGTLVPGDQLRNSAAIYFDFNPPVLTNEVVNTIASPVSGGEELFAASVEILPNPFSDYCVVRFANPLQERFELIVMDVNGKMLQSYANIQSEEVMIRQTAWPPGIYLFQLWSERQFFSGKLLLE